MLLTNPRNFRAELKTHLDHAALEPIRIVRRSKESFILMNENQLTMLHSEVSELQRRLLDSMQNWGELRNKD